MRVQRTCPISLSRNPLSIQVCFNIQNDQANALYYQVVIPYQFRSVSIYRKVVKQTFVTPVVIPYQFRSVSIQGKVTNIRKQLLTKS